MEKKVVLITGGSRGIGAATAQLFAKNHYDIALNYYTSTSAAKKLKDTLEKEYHVEVFLLPGDVSDEEKVKEIVNLSVEHFHKIDVLINNAGIALDQELEEKTSKEFKRVLDVNLVGSFLMSKYVGIVMRKQKSGKIIYISSTNGIDTYYPMSMDYDASKAGIISLMHNFANELAPNIAVNTVAPGWTLTDATKDMSPIFKQEQMEKILFHRFATTEEIASVVYFLTTKEASYINDTVIRVDGGVKH